MTIRTGKMPLFERLQQFLLDENSFGNIKSKSVHFTFESTIPIIESSWTKNTNLNYYKLLNIGQIFGRGQDDQDEWTEGKFQQKEVIFKYEAKATLEINNTKIKWID